MFVEWMNEWATQESDETVQGHFGENTLDGANKKNARLFSIIVKRNEEWKNDHFIILR